LRVKITVHGHVKSLLSSDQSEYEFEICQPTDVSELIEKRLEINPMVFASIVIDGEAVRRDYVVDQDCEILLISPTAGG